MVMLLPVGVSIEGKQEFTFYQNANKFETALLVRKLLDADDFVRSHFRATFEIVKKWRKIIGRYSRYNTSETRRIYQNKTTKQHIINWDSFTSKQRLQIVFSGTSDCHIISLPKKTINTTILLELMHEESELYSSYCYSYWLTQPYYSKSQIF